MIEKDSPLIFADFVSQIGADQRNRVSPDLRLILSHRLQWQQEATTHRRCDGEKDGLREDQELKRDSTEGTKGFANSLSELGIPVTKIIDIKASLKYGFRRTIGFTLRHFGAEL